MMTVLIVWPIRRATSCCRPQDLPGEADRLNIQGPMPGSACPPCSDSGGQSYVAIQLLPFQPPAWPDERWRFLLRRRANLQSLPALHRTPRLGQAPDPGVCAPGLSAVSKP